MSSRNTPAPVAPKVRELGKSFEPAEFESQVYEFWESAGCFEAAEENAPGQKSYCIVIPPPNVTGVLHMGHALTDTIEDILIRWRRMKGDNTLWLPGTDHAGIATQAQVERQIGKEGKGPTGKPLTRHDLGREKFLERTWKWKEDHESIILNQMRRMGASLDWSRYRFTLDEGFSRAVREVFVRLYEEGLIYRGERIINWCTRCQTALSDLEVIPTDRKGFFWHIRYPVVEEDGTPVKNADGSNAELIVATTRPETMLGDTAVAVHPEDERYAHLHGKFLQLPLLGRKIPLILDEYVDREFGSGAVKITPAHDFNDYDIGKRHDLPMVTVIDKEGIITAAGGPYAGLRVKEARERVVTDLKESRQLERTEDHAHKVGLCQRCDEVAEPLISKQWFVKIEPLAKPAIAAVETGKIEFVPKSWEKTYFEWMYNIRDWCISRQLWWGHQIPAWYCKRCQAVTVSRQDPDRCSQCSAPAAELKRDEDVLDTWFSSGLWPFGTLGWPDKTKALDTFYPGAVLETGFDIIFFWVARMIMMGMHFMGDVPFSKVYLHAMVRDEKGEKMSKSKGNVIDPLVVMDKHGADPLRFTFSIMAGQGRDIKLSVDRVEGYRAFCNKIWNATRFFHMNFEAAQKAGLKEPAEGVEKWLVTNKAQLLPTNRWILSELQKLTTTVDQALEKFEINVAAQAIYDFAWHEFCDWYIEFSKLPLREENAEQRDQTLITLHYALETLFRLAHPMMPFVTEELWQSLPWKKPAVTPTRARDGKPPVQTLMLQPFPQKVAGLVDAEAEHTVAALKGIIEAVRNFRGENQISPKKEFSVKYVTAHSAADIFVRLHQAEIMALTRVTGLERTQEGAPAKTEAVIPVANPALELRIDLNGLVDYEAETERLRKEIGKINEDIEHVRRKLSKESFVAKAPAELVAKERAKEQGLLAKREELEAALKRVGGLVS